MSILAIIYGLLALVFGLVFLIDCIRLRKQINAYVKYGITLGIILILLDVAVALLVPNFFTIVPVYMLVVRDVIALVDITISTCMGMYCCAVLGIHDIPLVRSLWRQSSAEEKIINRRWVGVGALTVLLGVAYSVMVFKATSPQIAPLLKELSEIQAARLGIGPEPSLMVVLVVVQFAFAEEVVFRLAVQNYLARRFKWQDRKYWIAVLFTSLFWSLAHANILDPEWVKIVQVFPLGIALGFLFRRYGAETCILVHGLFNIIVVFLKPLLLEG